MYIVNGGKSKWIKLHVGIDQKSGKLTLAEATGESSHDTSCLEKALKTCNKHKGRVLFAGIADSKKCYEACAWHNKKLLTPPNRALKMIKELQGDEIARSIWGKLTGYSRKSEIESTISAQKRILGSNLKSKSLEKSKKEVRIKAMINQRNVG